MKYACLLAGLCACIPSFIFSMGYKSRALHRTMSTASVQTYKPHPRPYDEELEAALQESLREQTRYNATRRQHHLPARQAHAAQGDISYEDALALAMAASLEIEQPRSKPEKTEKKTDTRPEHNIIKGDESCPICASTVEELGIEQARFTQCCHQFICKDDVQELEKRAAELYTNMQDPEWRRRYAASPDFTGWPYALEDIEQHRHAECPLCRHYPLEVELPAKHRDQHSGSRAPQQGMQEPSRQTVTQQEIIDIVNLFFKFLDTVVTKAVHDRNSEALRLLQQELTPWGSYEQFQALVHTILCVRPEIKLHEHEIINTVWEHIIRSIPAIEREQLILEDTLHILSQYEKRYQILIADSMDSLLLETWQAHLGHKGLHVWNMLNPAQKLFYLSRLQLQCQLADIIEHIA